MSQCPNKYVALACDQLGVATFGEAFCKSGKVMLKNGQGRNLPDLKAGQIYHALLTIPCQPVCEEVIVTGKSGDELTISRYQNRTDCFPTGTTITYLSCSVDAIRAIARVSRPNYKWPLVYDCETDTVYIDCAGIKELVRKPCGVVDEDNKISGGGA